MDDSIVNDTNAEPIDEIPEPHTDNDLIDYVKSLQTTGRPQTLIADELKQLLKKRNPELTDDDFKTD